MGEPINDRTLVLNVIRGLNERFHDACRHLRCSHPFPKYKETLAELTLEKLTMAHQASSPSTALLTATGKAASSASFLSSRPPQQPSLSKNSGSKFGGAKRDSKDSKSRRSKSGGKPSTIHGTPASGGSQYDGQGPSAPNTGDVGSITLPFFLNPWTEDIHMWPSTRPLAQAPVQQQQQALMA